MKFHVTADHVNPQFACDVTCEVRQDSYDGTFSVFIPEYGHSKSYADPESAIEGMLKEHACTNIRITRIYETEEMRDICIDAINGALVTRGKRKGALKAQCPESSTDAAAAWQALMGYANPYKVSIGQIMWFTDRQRVIYRAIDDALKGADLRHMDRDALALSIMGAW